MENHRMAVAEQEQKINDIEMAHYILLSLYREYSIRLLKKPQNKENYVTKMRQIKHDMRYLTRQELIYKVQQLYLPNLKRMEKE